MADTLVINLGIVAAMMLGLWLLSLHLRDASIVDPFWGSGFVVVAWVSLLCNLPASSRMTLMTGLVTLWGLRLSIHLLIRNWGHGEDQRYVAMREKHGARFWYVSLFSVFLLQGLILWFVSLPVQAVAARSDQAELNWLDFLGVAVWAIGFFFEAVGDWQLSRFKSDPQNQGKVFDRGLWRYTRHPNYFGDFCVWWGLFVISLSAGAWWTLGSPVLMAILLMKVSGVTLLEKDIVERRPDYAAYKRRTNDFFPGFPRHQ